jgi:hypothetical protein
MHWWSLLGVSDILGLGQVNTHNQLTHALVQRGAQNS